MIRTTLMTTVALCLAVMGVGAQQTPRERAQQTLPPEVFRDLTTLAGEMAAEGVPAEPLYAKALEGAAKRVPPPALLPAVRAYAGRLGAAQASLRSRRDHATARRRCGRDPTRRPSRDAARPPQ